MSGDWFEEALDELDEEFDADEETVDLDVDDEPVDLDVDDEPTDLDIADADVDDESDSVDSDGHGESDSGGSGENTPVDSGSDGDEDGPDANGEETDVFGFDSDDPTASSPSSEDRPDADTDESEAKSGLDSSTAQSPEEFGFSTDSEAESDSDTDQADSSESEQSDPFGFNSDDSTETQAESDEADAVETADRPDSASTPRSETDQSQARSGSTAQSPEEFGFSVDDSDDTAGGSTPAVDDGDDTADTPTPEADDDSEDDPFGFGSGGGNAGGQSTPSMDQSGDDDFGFGGFSGGGGGGSPAQSSPEEFDEEDFESNIDRIDLGIDGLDDMILGGVPERSLIGIIGGAGTGKTTFGLQFLNEALRNGERAVFITLEQTEEAVLSTAEEKGWPFREYVDDDQLAVVVLDPVEMANSLASIRGDISRLIGEFGASRLVLDSVSLLEMMYDHPAKRRSEVFDFTRSLKEAGVTTLLTSEASEDSSHASRYGAVEYLTDAVFVLRYVRTSNFEETRLAIEIQKIRDANHSRATKPYDLTDEGMSVHRQANIF